MLYDLNLDDRSYREIEEEAVFHIQREYPEWTNYNPSDPGITLVQLLSWLTEVQQYHLSQPDEWKRRKYLKLLGVKPHHIHPAFGAVNVEPGPGQMESTFPILKGTRFFAGELSFETARKEWVSQIRLIGAYRMQGNSLNSYHNMEQDAEKQIQLYPFGRQPETNNQCYFILDGTPCQEQRIEMFFAICTKYEVTRNPADEQFLPLASLRWEYYCQEGWEELQVESDGTYGFVQSGKIRFYMPKQMAREECFQTYQIRVMLGEHDLDTAPLIQNIYLNEIDVLQQYSVCDYESFEINLSGHKEEFSLCSSLYLADRGDVELYLEKGEGWILLKESRREKTERGISDSGSKGRYGPTELESADSLFMKRKPKRHGA